MPARPVGASGQRVNHVNQIELVQQGLFRSVCVGAVPRQHVPERGVKSVRRLKRVVWLELP